MIPFWTDDRGCDGGTYSGTEWDLLHVGGSPVPGIVEIDITAERKVDVKEAAGKHGATVTFKGRRPSRFTARVRIWRKEQWESLQVLLDEIWPLGGAGDPIAFTVQHPMLDMAWVSASAVESVSGPTPTGVEGERVVTIKFIEFTAAKKAAKVAKKTLEQAETQSRPEFKEYVTSAANGKSINFVPDNYVEALPSTDASYLAP